MQKTMEIDKLYKINSYIENSANFYMVLINELLKMFDGQK